MTLTQVSTEAFDKLVRDYKPEFGDEWEDFIDERVLRTEWPTVDVDLMQAIYNWVDAESKKPQEERLWDQANWAREKTCGTAYCVAGYAAAATGYKFEDTAGGFLVNCTRDGRTLNVWDAANTELGITDAESEILYAAENTLEDVRMIMDAIMERAGTRLAV